MSRYLKGYRLIFFILPGSWIMSEKVRKSIVVQGSILAFAGIISKIIGFLYRIPLANIMGNTGNGLYSVSFGIYNIALTLSSYSMPLALSKLLSERLAADRYKDAHKLYRRAFIFAAVMGALACLTVFLGADFFAALYKRDGLARPLRVLAPTTFVVALLGTCRGYYQGHKNMVPTAVSQVIEQIINALVSVYAASYFVKTCEVPGDEAALGAMGGTCGTLAGALFALVMFLFLFWMDRKKIRAEKQGDDEETEDNKLIFRSILLTVIPIIISQSIYQFGYTLDDFLYGNIMNLKAMDPGHATSLQGVFNTQYNQMVNLPVAVATSMASATLPSIVASYTIGDKTRVSGKIDSVLKINMLIAIPSAVGLAVLADPIMTVLFPGLGEYHDNAVLLLMTGSSAVVFYALSTLSTSILQGCNKMNVPVIHSGVSLIIHGIVVSALLYFTDLNVYALVIGNVTFPLVVCILNIRSIVRLLGYRFDITNVFFKPIIASIAMGLVTKGIYQWMLSLNDGDRSGKLIGLCVSVVVAMVTYACCLVLTGAFSREELKRMPIMRRLFRK